jgi:NAD(P)-dependent dehydrogenase (short-subunit alcohol dehydrogenase family)
MRLDGRIALITGAASGIGRVGALAFAKAGALVALSDRDGAGLDAVVAEVNAGGGTAVALVADLAERDAPARTVEGTVAAFGGIDVMWCNAGILGPTEVEGIDPAHYDQAVAINMTAPIAMADAAARHMRARGGGSMIITASTSGLVGSISGPVYTATKFAVVGYVKSLAQRLAADGIRVNALCPGATATPLLRNTMENGTSALTGPEYTARILSSIPMGRLAEPAEIAHAALFLASDYSTYVTGIALPVDGGFTSR